MEKFPILEFLKQQDHSEGFITGPGGSGKTEALIDIIKELNANKITYQIVAYTNKAADVIRNRVPEAPVSTLHSWLKKRPGINSMAKSLHTLITSKQYGEPEPLQLLIVDEFSMIDEADYFSIGDLVDPDFEGVIKLHTLYIGDLSQLSPIKGACPIIPQEPFWVQLTKIYRTTNSLQKPLGMLRDMIQRVTDGESVKSVVKPLKPNKNFIRKVNIIEEYKKCESSSKVLLAYTNEKVEHYNKMLQGRAKPIDGDIVFDSTSKKVITIARVMDKAEIRNRQDIVIQTPIGSINWETKYNPIKTLLTLAFVNYYEVEINGEEYVIAGIFGSYVNKKVREFLGNDLVQLNRENKDSSKAYKIYKTVNDCTHHLDFNYCITTHKTQGSEWDYVFIDSEDYNRCLNMLERLKLLYVGISRAKETCFMNT